MSLSKTFNTVNLNNKDMKEWISLLTKRTKEDKVVLSKKAKFSSSVWKVFYFLEIIEDGASTSTSTSTSTTSTITTGTTTSTAITTPATTTTTAVSNSITTVSNSATSAPTTTTTTSANTTTTATTTTTTVTTPSVSRSFQRPMSHYFGNSNTTITTTTASISTLSTASRSESTSDSSESIAPGGPGPNVVGVIKHLVICTKCATILRTPGQSRKETGKHIGILLSESDSVENNIFDCKRRADTATPVYKPKRFQFTQYIVENESDNSEEEEEEFSTERIVQAELEKFENLRKGFKPKQTETAGLNFDIAAWWKDNVNKFPILAACAFRLLSVPASGAPAERVNSKLEFLSRGNKSRIDSTTLSNR
eukprot:Pgem_evm2s11072